MLSGLRHKDLVFIDTETTGIVFGFHEIIDVAAIKCSADGREIKERWNTRIKPKYPERATESAKSANGFSYELWAHCDVNSSDIWEEFASRFSGCVPVCHNPSFDRAFITLAATAAGVNSLGVDYHWIGTESIAWPIYKQGKMGDDLNLFRLCEMLRIEPEPVPHTALGGAESCFRLYRGLMTLFYESG